MFLPKAIIEENSKECLVSNFSENLNSINIHALMKSITDNTKKVLICTFPHIIH